MGRALLAVFALAALVFALAVGCNESDDGGGTPAAQTTTETDGGGGDASDEFNMLVLDKTGIVDVAVVYPADTDAAEPGVASQSERFDQPVSPAVAARDYVCGSVPEGGVLTYAYDTPIPPPNSTELIERFEDLARATFCPE